jgi:ABC-2 type transport system permease protein
MFWQLVLKDLKIFFSDRRAMMISILVPIGIASFMASIFGNAGKAATDMRVPLLVVDNDGSATSKKAVENLSKSANLAVKTVSEGEAREEVKTGKAAVALIFPPDFGEKLSISFAPDSEHTRASAVLLSDPAQNTAAQAARGLVMQPVMQAVFGGGAELKPPFDLKQESAAAASKDSNDGGVAHVFAGMAVQGLLFFSIEAAMGVMRERKQGIWKRVRAAPVSPLTILLARIVSGAMRALTILIAVLGFGALVFHLHLGGNLLGLSLICVAAALMAATFGLFVAALGRNEQQSRGLAIFVVLLMTMLGGAWFPSFLMPQWVQTISLAVPVKWAVDGLDAMTWRGGDLSAVPAPVGALLVFALVFGVIALTRFRWEGEAA